MLPASNRGAGQNLGFPDVCLTPAPPAPPVPVPYPNIAMNAQALAFSPVVKVSGVNALNLGSTISMTSGDEGGVAHATMKGVGKYTMGNPIVKIDKLPAINLACPTTGNMMNNPIGLVAVPSAVNVTYCDAAVPERVDDAELDALAERMARPGVTAEKLPGGVALVRIDCFGAGLATEVFRALHAFGEGATGFVFDLRGCPGGDVEAALALAGEVCREGLVALTITEADGEVTRLERAASGRYPGPVVVVTDRDTASAAEVFVALLREARRATTVGQATRGKRTAYRLGLVPGASRRLDAGTWSVAGASSGPLAPDVELPTPAPDARDDAWLRTAWALAVRDA